MAAEHTRAIAEGIYANMPTTAIEIIAAAIEETDAEDDVRSLRGNSRRQGKGAAVTRLTEARGNRREGVREAGVSDGS